MTKSVLEKKVKCLFWLNNFLLVFVMFAYIMGANMSLKKEHQKDKAYIDQIVEARITLINVESHYQIELELSNTRNDIYKRQIKDLLNANAGLKTIIKGSPKLKHLVR